MEFNNVEELEKYLTQKINNSLEEEVSKQARKTMKEVIETEVYAKYTPYEDVKKPYTRQRKDGGLLDDENIHTGLVNDGELVIRNTRTNEHDDELGYSTSPYRDVAAIVEYGTNYNWNNSKIYHIQPFPRPFHEKTAERLKQEGLAKKALTDGLKRNGLDVK
jgi:hypothetical protein